MLPGSSPKKRKKDDNEDSKNEQTLLHELNDYFHGDAENDDMPSCSTKRPRQETATISETSSQYKSENVRDTLIRDIISREFNREIKLKGAQLELVDERLEEAKNLLGRLRYAIVAEYYNKQEQSQTMIDAIHSQNITIDKNEQTLQVPLHPSIKQIIGKRPQNTTESVRTCPKREAAKNAKHVLGTKSAVERREERRLQKTLGKNGEVIDHAKQTIKVEHDARRSSTLNHKSRTAIKDGAIDTRLVKLENTLNQTETPSAYILNKSRTGNKVKCHFVVGNTSKFVGKNDERAQMANKNSFSHKWLVYVQNKDSQASIEKYIKKVRFFLHPSYGPNDVVDIHEAPFQVARRGWGEFPMRIQLFFHDIFQQKPLQLIHNVVLDTTKSGHHTLGAETVVEIWLRDVETVTTDVKHEKCEKILPSDKATSAMEIKLAATAPVAEASTKPRTISFNIKETFDDNFFDFLNKIEESRTSICADIEKIEPTLLVNEPLEPQFSNTLRSPIKREHLVSPLKLSPARNITMRLTPHNVQTRGGNHALISPSALPKAIKVANTKLTAAINQNRLESNDSVPDKETNKSKLGNQLTQITIQNPSALLTTTSTTHPSSTVSSNISSAAAATKPIAINNTFNNIAQASGKLFSNASGTVILPVAKDQLPTQQKNISNKAVFQKKTIQLVNAQGQIKTVQMLVATTKAMPVTLTTKPLTFSSSTSQIQTTTSRPYTAISSTKTDNIKIACADVPAQHQGTSKLLPTNSTRVTNSKLEILAPSTSTHAAQCIPFPNLSEQHCNIKGNKIFNTIKPLATSVSKNVVFQREGKLFIIDPLQMKLKQQRKNQISLLKPQLKLQAQQQNTTMKSVASDHDYAPPPPLRWKNSLSASSNQHDILVRTPQVHLGMRETRLGAVKAQDYQKWQRIQFEQKFYSRQFSSMRSAVEYLLRYLPLIVTDKESPAIAFPFVKSSVQEFHSLPAFKQRSYEWLRAKFIARILRNHKSLQALHGTAAEKFWSTREIASFARFFAHTPPIKALQQDANLSGTETIPGRKENFTTLIKTEIKSEQLQFEYDTLSPASEISNWVDNMQQHLKSIHRQFSTDEIISIDDGDADTVETISKAKAASEVMTKQSSTLTFQNNLSYLPTPARLDNAFQYVGDICKDISIRLCPEEILPGILHPSAQTVLAHISQLFVERLLRQSIADQSLHEQEEHTSSSHLPHNSQEQNLTLQDIRKTISQCAEYDFLTNRNLGVPSQHIKKE